MSLTAWIKEQGADRGQLDILVEDIFAQRAMGVNIRGLKSQLQVLRQVYKDKDLKNLISHEMQVLQRHGMVMQSKNIPKNNIRYPKKKKRRKV